MAKTAETIRDPEAVEKARQELAELPEGKMLTWDEVSSYVRRLGITMPPGWTSAHIIRELRGPLPEDDPDFVNVDRR